MCNVRNRRGNIPARASGIRTTGTKINLSTTEAATNCHAPERPTSLRVASSMTLWMSCSRSPRGSAPPLSICSPTSTYRGLRMTDEKPSTCCFCGKPHAQSKSARNDFRHLKTHAKNAPAQKGGAVLRLLPVSMEAMRCDLVGRVKLGSFWESSK